MMNKAKKQIGAIGESIAVDYLKSKDYKILHRNFRSKHGEIDIIAYKNKCIYFIEVKTSLHGSCIQPEDNINKQKKNQLIKLANEYLAYNSERAADSFQIDAIAITLNMRIKKARLKHIKGCIAT